MIFGPRDNLQVKSARSKRQGQAMSSRRIPAQRSESKNSVASSYDSANGGTFGTSYSNSDRMRKGLSSVLSVRETYD